MRSLLISTVLLGFISVAVFGAFAMQPLHHSGGCIAASVQGVVCPNQSNLFESLAFHLDALRDFSTAIFGAHIVASLLMLAMLIAGAGLALLLGATAPPQPSRMRARYRPRESFRSPLQQALLRWLSLHENSPAAA